MSNANQDMSGEELRRRLAFSDAQLVAECEVHRHRAGGPGGQHRNKVSSAIRLCHKPSGLVAVATESRLQNENKLRAVKRLREAIALAARAPLPQPVVWPERVQIIDGSLRMNEKNPALIEVTALILDGIAQCGGSTKDAAKLLGLTSSSLSRFIKAHPKIARQAEHIRQNLERP